MSSSTGQARAGARVLRAGALFSAGEIVAKLAGMAALAIWMRYLTPAEFGRLELFRTGMLIAAIPLGLGLSAAVGRYYVDLDRQAFRGLLSSTLMTIAALSGLLGLFVLLVPGGVFFDELWRWGWAWVVAGAAANALQTPLRSAFVVQGRAGAHLAVVLMQSLAAVALATWFLLGLQWGVWGLLAGLGLGASLGTLLGLVLSRTSLGWTFDRAVLHTGLIYSIPLIPHLLAHSVMSYADRAALVGLASDAEAGTYGAAYLVASGLTILALSLNRAMLPVIYGVMKRLMEQQPTVDPGDDARPVMSTLTNAWLTLCAWLTMGFLVLGPELIFWVLPVSYHAGLTLFPIIIWGLALHATYMVSVNVLMYRALTRYIATTSIACALLNVLLNVLLIPSMGGFGAALATLLSYAGLAVAIFLRAQRIIDLPMQLDRHLIAAVLLLAVAVATPWLTADLAPLLRLGVRFVVTATATLLIAQPLRTISQVRWVVEATR